MRSRSNDRRRSVVTKIIGFVLIGESVALPAWGLIHEALHRDKPAQAQVTVRATGEEIEDNAGTIVPITIYDGPVPVPTGESNRPR